MGGNTDVGEFSDVGIFLTQRTRSARRRFCPRITRIGTDGATGWIACGVGGITGYALGRSFFRAFGDLRDVEGH